MPAKNDSFCSNADPDPTFIAMQAQQRMMGFKKERDERVKSIVVESQASLHDLRLRVVENYEKARQESFKAQAQRVTRMIEAKERRQQLEVEMVGLVTRMYAAMNQVEEMMLVGFEAREMEAASSMKKLGLRLEKKVMTGAPAEQYSNTRQRQS